MSERSVTVNFGGIIIPLLGVLFIGLKLTDHIDWSWWWVLAPFWLGLAVLLAIGLIAGIIMLIAALVAK